MRAKTSFKNPTLLSEAAKRSNNMSFNQASFNRDNSKEGGKTIQPVSTQTKADTLTSCHYNSKPKYQNLASKEIYNKIMISRLNEIKSRFHQEI